MQLKKIASDKKNAQQNNSANSKQNITEIFQCICGKSYFSFPALYLHLRKKHDINIGIIDKQTMPKRKIWSGKQKKIIYEFNEKEKIQKNHDTQESFKKTEEPLKKKKASEEDFASITSVFSEYQNCISLSIRQASEKLIVVRELFTYIRANKQSFKLLPQLCNIVKKEKYSPELIPFTLNYFVMEYVPFENQLVKIPSEKIIQSLYHFIQWAYKNKYCSCMVQISSEYRKNQV